MRALFDSTEEDGEAPSDSEDEDPDDEDAERAFFVDSMAMNASVSPDAAQALVAIQGCYEVMQETEEAAAVSAPANQSGGEPTLNRSALQLALAHGDLAQW